MYDILDHGRYYPSACMGINTVPDPSWFSSNEIPTQSGHGQVWHAKMSSLVPND